jgi:RNA polymerase sigma-70 factor, ECF subfamily
MTPGRVAGAHLTEERPTVDQRRLVEQARLGDHDAFAELARIAVVRLDRAARLILRDPELARDAVQDALFRAWRDLPGLREPARFDAWLHRLTVNACIDMARKRRRRVAEVELSPFHEPAVADTARALADRDQVDRMLRRLDERERAVVVLHYYLGLPLTEVAGTLGIPLGTAKSRLNRALGLLRSSLANDPEILAPAPVAGGQPA